jgi:mono/diheme cytochrome c family protein
MSRKIELFAAAAVLSVAAAIGGGAIAQGAAPAIYTAEQATAGAQVYAAQCGACHGNQLEGVAGPALKGPGFKAMATAQGLNGESLLQVVSLSMPQTDPGSLSPEQYAQVVAYMLRENGYPAGSEPLSTTNPHLKELDLAK